MAIAEFLNGGTAIYATIQKWPVEVPFRSGTGGLGTTPAIGRHPPGRGPHPEVRPAPCDPPERRRRPVQVPSGSSGYRVVPLDSSVGRLHCAVHVANIQRGELVYRQIVG